MRWATSDKLCVASSRFSAAIRLRYPPNTSPSSSDQSRAAPGIFSAEFGLRLPARRVLGVESAASGEPEPDPARRQPPSGAVTKRDMQLLHTQWNATMLYLCLSSPWFHRWMRRLTGCCFSGLFERLEPGEPWCTGRVSALLGLSRGGLDAMSGLEDALHKGGAFSCSCFSSGLGSFFGLSPSALVPLASRRLAGFGCVGGGARGIRGPDGLRCPSPGGLLAMAGERLARPLPFALGKPSLTGLVPAVELSASYRVTMSLIELRRP